MTGKVCSILPDKGFFFIRVIGDDGGRVDYFAHKESLPTGIRIDQLIIGDEYHFDPVHTSKGPRAENLRPSAVTKPIMDLDDLLAEHHENNR